MAQDKDNNLSSAFDGMLDQNRKRLDDLMDARPTPPTPWSPGAAPAKTERHTKRHTEHKSGHIIEHRTGRIGGRDFSFEFQRSHDSKGEIEMALPQVGDLAPAFSMRNQQGADTTLEQHNGHYVVLWWYPKADTPG